jgi:hypothetical protein
MFFLGASSATEVKRQDEDYLNIDTPRSIPSGREGELNFNLLILLCYLLN